MIAKKRRGDRRQDFFFNKAKEEGYPARSVYKLKEIDEKYHIIKRDDTVLDLGSAPGAWMMYLSQKVGEKGRVIGVDFQNIEISLKSNAEFIKGDIRRILSNQRIKDLRGADSGEGLFDIIVSDVAPKTTGVKFADAEKSLELAEEVLNIAKELLKNKGHLIIKIFDGEGVAGFIKVLERHFEKVKRYRPGAVRKQSREFYAVCRTLQYRRLPNP